MYRDPIALELGRCFGSSAAVMVVKFQSDLIIQPNSRLWDFVKSHNMTSYRLVNRSLVRVSSIVCDDPANSSGIWRPTRPFARRWRSVLFTKYLSFAVIDGAHSLGSTLLFKMCICRESTGYCWIYAWGIMNRYISVLLVYLNDWLLKRFNKALILHVLFCEETFWYIQNSLQYHHIMPNPRHDTHVQCILSDEQ